MPKSRSSVLSRALLSAVTVSATLAAATVAPMTTAHAAVAAPRLSSAVSQLGTVAPVAATSVSPLAQVAADGELPGLRTQTSRTFRDGDAGVLRTTVSTGPVNFKDGAGAWQPIDDSLVPAPAGSGFGWQNRADGYLVQFPTDLADGPVKVTTGAAWVGLRLAGAHAVGQVSGATVTYRDALPGVTVAYTATATGPKETLTLASPAAAAAPFAFTVTTSPGLAGATAGGAVQLSDTARKLLFTLTRPWAVDPKDSVTGFLDAVRLGSVPNPDGSLAVAMSVAPSWLTATGRSWPVTIDPTVTIAGATLQDCTILDGVNANTNFCTRPASDVGEDPGKYVARSLLQLDVGAVPSDATVLTADLKLSAATGTGNATTTAVPVEVHRNQVAWTTSATWNTSDGTTGWGPGGSPAPMVEAAGRVGPLTGTMTDWHFYPRDLVQSWVNRVVPNTGLILTTPVFLQGGGVHFVSNDGSTAATASSLTVLWTPQLGSRDGNTFVTTRLSDHSQAQVNVGNGNLLVSDTELSLKGVGQDFSLTRYYNSRNNNVLTKADTVVGQGNWKLSTGMFLTQTGGSMLLRQPDGASLVFPRNPDGTLRMATGAGADLTRVASDDHYELKMHKTHAVYTFRKTGSQTAGNTSYQLTEVNDGNATPNKTTYGYTTPTLPDVPAGLTKVTDSAGRAISFSYYTGASPNYINAVSSATTPARTIGYAFTNNQLTGATDTDGKTTGYSYDSNGLLAQITDPLGNQTRFGYDSAGRVTTLTRVTDPASGAGYTTRFAYTLPTVGASTVTTVVDGPRTDVTDTTTYTAQNTGDAVRVTDTKDALGKTTSTSYTNNGTVKSATSAGGGVTTNEYGLGDDERLTKTTGPLGASSTAKYEDPNHSYLASSTTSSSGNTSTYSYSGPGNLDSSSDAGAAKASLSRLPNGQVDTATDPTNQAANNPTRYSYDATQQLNKITPPTGNTLAPRLFSYDARSRLTTATSGRNMTTSNSYDGRDRVTGQTYSDPALTAVTVTYDANGNVTRRVDASGTTNYSYDPLGRVTAIWRGTAPASSCPTASATTSCYSYDATGNLTSLADGGGASSYSYDARNLLSRLVDRNGLPTAFAYNDDRKRTDSWYNAGVGQVPTSWAGHVKSRFDKANRLVQITTTRGSTDNQVVGDLCYGYSPAATGQGCVSGTTALPNDRDSRQWVIDRAASPATLTTYTFSTSERLTRAETVGVALFTYGYDANGNRTSDPGGSHTFNSANQLTDPAYTPGGSAAYDADGNLTANPGSTIPLSAITNNTSNQTTSITPSGGSPIGFTYRGADQTDRASIGSTTLNSGLIDLQSQTGPAGTAYFERDPGGSLVSMRTAGSTYYYAFDGLGSITALIKADGTVAARYSYDPYGRTMTLNGPDSNPADTSLATANPYGYASGYTDRTTSLVKYGQRYYDPALGRWTQQDSIEVLGDPAQGNRYAYAGDDPISKADPTGNSWLSVVGSGILFATAIIAIPEVSIPVAVGSVAGTGALYLDSIATTWPYE